MKYISTRGQSEPLDFEDALLMGMAPDGGLYVPAEWPEFSPAKIASFSSLSYPELALSVITPFVGNSMDRATLADLIDQAYRNFSHRAIAPMVQIGHGEWVLELFHGPTLAFKDFALQLLGGLLEHALKKRSRHVTIVGATSGDTGSAAIAGCQGKEHMDMFILHPKGRVSDVQRRQMTTIQSQNVHNIAIDGTFDDCQALVKAMFNDTEFRNKHHLAAVNSINWARIMAQIVYYFYAAVQLGAPWRSLSFVVPTGNFGNIFAGYAAKKMGLPIRRLILATGRNDILSRFIRTGRYESGEVHPTIAPSIDIQVASNFERLLFDMVGRESSEVRRMMEEFSKTGLIELDESAMNRLHRLFASATIQEDTIRQTIGDVYQESGMLLDPHSAVGVAAGRELRQGNGEGLVYLATAHPAKFPDAVREATGVIPDIPERLQDALSGEERCENLPNDLATVEQYIEEHV